MLKRIILENRFESTYVWIDKVSEMEFRITIDLNKPMREITGRRREDL